MWVFHFQEQTYFWFRFNWKWRFWELLIFNRSKLENFNYFLALYWENFNTALPLNNKRKMFCNKFWPKNVKLLRFKYLSVIISWIATESNFCSKIKRQKTQKEINDIYFNPWFVTLFIGNIKIIAIIHYACSIKISFFYDISLAINYWQSRFHSLNLFEIELRLKCLNMSQKRSWEFCRDFEKN